MSEYKVGDYIVYEGEEYPNGLFKVEKVSPKKGYPQKVSAGSFGNINVDRYRIRLATEKEIAQGYRDE